VVPEDFTDEDAVMVEPAACGIHAALAADVPQGGTVVVLGAGTLGLTTVAALRRMTFPGTLVVAAKHPRQRALARELGADVVNEPREVARTVRRLTGAFEVGDGLSGGVDVTVDCVGSADTIAHAMAITRPTGKIVLVGMPGSVRVDLTPLWHKELRLGGAYAYGVEKAGRTFDMAFDLVRDAGLARLVSAAYPLDQYRDALSHAANAGARGAVKIVFDLRSEKRR
jgi:threonine dehydrogenase-like Zn-dependent dehydrogenase